MPIFPLLFLFFLLVPILEIYLLLKVGAEIGVGLTVGLVVFTAVLGAYLVRVQGISTLFRLRQQIEAGNIPAQEMVDGVAILIAGALLLTPGFFTDTIGFILLIPYLRVVFFQRLLKKVFMAQSSQTVWVKSYSTSSGDTNSKKTVKSSTVIEGEYRSDDD